MSPDLVGYQYRSIRSVPSLRMTLMLIDDYYKHQGLSKASCNSMLSFEQVVKLVSQEGAIEMWVVWQFALFAPPSPQLWPSRDKFTFIRSHPPFDHAIPQFTTKSPPHILLQRSILISPYPNNTRPQPWTPTHQKEVQQQPLSPKHSS